MRLDFVTLFPEMFESVLGSSILKRAAEAVALPGAADSSDVREPVVSYHLHNPRDYAENKHNKVDDTPYGGGPGMVMQCQPVFDCVQAAEAEQPGVQATRVFVTPTGRPLTQKLVEELASKPRLLILCGHYEGFDQRLLDELEPMEVSLGDYVLTGGELPAMVLADSVVRLLPGVIGKAGSHVNDSFSPGLERLLDHPHYTRPPEWMGREVPKVLLSGDHGKIEAWRRKRSRKLTKERRPDLLPRTADSILSRFAVPFVLRDALEQDYRMIDDLLSSSFATTAEAKLVHDLREAGDAPIEIVAELEGQIVGLVLLSPVTVDGGDGRLRGLGLAPVAVDSYYRGIGVGTALVHQALNQAKAVRAGAVFVLGEPEYYARFGFETASEHGFGNEYGVDKPFMVKPLKDQLGPAGLARYAPAFQGL